MATDSIVTFVFDDDTPHICLHVPHSTHPEDFIPYLKEKILSDPNNNYETKLNWDIFASQLTSDIIKDYRKTIIINFDDKVNFKNTIYQYTIKPIAEKYSDPNSTILDAITATVSYFKDDELIFDGSLLSCKKKDLLPEDSFVFKNRPQAEIIDFLNNIDNFKDVNPYNTNYLKPTYGLSDSEEIIDIYRNHFTANEHSFFQHHILNSGVEILRAGDWVVVCHMGFVQNLVSGYELMNPQVTPKNDLYIIVGHESSITIQDNGEVFYSLFR